MAIMPGSSSSFDDKADTAGELVLLLRRRC
jgi:hypothetical protein